MGGSAQRVHLNSPQVRPLRTFEGHEKDVVAVAVFPDRRRMVTASYDKTLCIWDLIKGVLLKKIEGHRSEVWALAVSRDGQFIASGSKKGELIVWHGGSNGSLRHTIAKVHESYMFSLDFSPDGAALATGSWDEKTKLWSTESWQLQGDPMNCRAAYKQTIVYCVRYSPSGEHLAIATENDIQIWDPSTRTCITTFKGHAAISAELKEGGEIAYNYTLQWTPDGKRLLSGGSQVDSTIRVWDAPGSRLVIPGRAMNKLASATLPSILLALLSLPHPMTHVFVSGSC